MNAKFFTFFSAVLMLAVAGGCTSMNNNYGEAENKEYYFDRAREMIEEYRIVDNKDFYGFKMGEKFEVRDDYEILVDNNTGCRMYRFKDTNGTFDKVIITTDDDGRIIQIWLDKSFATFGGGHEFFLIVREKLLETYKAADYLAGDKFRYHHIYVASDDNEWLQKYSDYLKEKEQGTSIFFSGNFAYILHPLLKKIECSVGEFMGVVMVTLKYTGKEYVNMQKRYKQKQKEKLKKL